MYWCIGGGIYEKVKYHIGPKILEGLFGKGYIMKILESTSLLCTIWIVATSIYGVTFGLQMLFFVFGLKEIIGAKEYYDNL